MIRDYCVQEKANDTLPLKKTMGPTLAEDKEVLSGWFTVICASFNTSSAGSRSKIITPPGNSSKQF